MNRFTRRRLLSLTARLLSTGAVLSFLPGCERAAESQPGTAGSIAEPGPDPLEQLCRDLFPHDGLPGSVYAGVALTVRRGLAGAEQEYSDFIGRLQAATGASGWAGLPQDGRDAILQGLDETPFFNRLWGLVSGALYTHPQVWSLIGYGGNAYEQGGYLTRGFDDIDWLEATP